MYPLLTIADSDERYLVDDTPTRVEFDGSSTIYGDDGSLSVVNNVFELGPREWLVTMRVQVWTYDGNTINLRLQSQDGLTIFADQSHVVKHVGVTDAEIVMELTGVIDGSVNPAVVFVAVADLLSPMYGASLRHRVANVSAMPVLSGVHARYNSSSAQSIPNTADTLVAFDGEAEAHPYISRIAQGAGHRFTFQKSGIWAVTTTTRFVGGGGAGERYSALVSNNYGSAGVITADGGYNGSAPETHNLSYTGYFPAGSYVEASVWQNSGAALDLEGSPIWKNITFALVRP